MKPILAFTLALLLGLPGLPCFAETVASGHYRMGEQRFEIAQGVAIRLWQDDERESWGVVLGEGPFDPEAAVGALDPLDRIAASSPDGSGVLLLSLRRDAGAAIELGSVIARPDSFSTNGDGKEDIAVADGRIRGEWSKPASDFFGKTFEMSMRFDLPLIEIADPGQPLAVGGGAPGEAYLGFVEALRKRDSEQVLARQALPEDLVEVLGVDALVEIAAMNHPTSAEVVGGWIDGERAQLRVRGPHTFGQIVRGRVEMRQINGAWKVGDAALR
ncbi:MAG: hypothetical protein MEQ07_11725 [Aquimonas sp.]|nr:hypothetical protein [Aquimonas sp.]